MPAETESNNIVHKNMNDSIAFTLRRINKTSKEQSTQEDEAAKKVNVKESNGSEKKIMAQDKAGPKSRKTYCICSPTSHAGSFRCRHHRTSDGSSGRKKNNKSCFNAKNVRTTIGDGQPTLSRFAKAACENGSLTMASSKPEKVTQSLRKSLKARESQVILYNSSTIKYSNTPTNRN